MEIYLDYNATTPIDPKVANTMKPFLYEYFGNPSSVHKYGISTKKAVEKARKQVSELINCNPWEIIFTSGGTESNNYAIKGIAHKNRYRGNHIITSQIEHPAVIEVCKYLEKNGFRVTYLPVDKYGLIDAHELEKEIRKETILISIMHANNEIGTIQPVGDIGEIAEKHNIIFHTDAAQSAGKVQIDVQRDKIGLLSVAGHKLYAPKGIGALYIREGIELEKLIHGADHERNLRAGTENVLEIAGLGKACEIAGKNLEANKKNMKFTRDLLEKKITQALDNIKINGHTEKRLPNTSSISFPGVEANILLNELSDSGIAASAGAACHTDSIDVSSVLSAIKLEEKYAMGTIRFSTGKFTTKEEIDEAVNIIKEKVKNLQPENKPANDTIQETSEIKLTHYTQGMGCACKLRPQELEKIIQKFNLNKDPNILIDSSTADDAAVYKINSETAIVQTLDFFTPIVDSPYDFGAIAATNALSDIYAMGAEPIFALNIVGFPSSRLSISILQDILSGAKDKVKEAGISVLGGHTIDDPEPKYGLVVTGIVHPDKILRNSTAKINDAIILTKPVGTGILSTAIKRGLTNTKVVEKITQLMTSLNNKAAKVIKQYPVNACTDVTGFGLLGHLHEITSSSRKDALLSLENIPVIEETWEFAAGDIIPGGTRDNLEYLKEKTLWDEGISEIQKLITNDAQTSGGLLFTVPEKYTEQIIKDLANEGLKDAACIGKITREGNGKIQISKK